VEAIKLDRYRVGRSSVVASAQYVGTDGRALASREFSGLAIDRKRGQNAFIIMTNLLMMKKAF
jgi:cytochrome c biogenesis protein ResB